LREEERSRRLANIHAPFHDAIDACLTRRMSSGRPTALVAIHSFTPVYFGKARPWQIGILFDDDRRLADLLIGGLEADSALTVGINQPYSPADGVYYTLGRHARPWGLPAAMIEIRNDEIGNAAGQQGWASRLGDILFAATPGLFESSHAMV
jgi:predicted N-formylglutamate amidohydrolase